jgi:hypothetical protein
MRTLLVINDNSSETKHAAEFAFAIAKKMQANILLANTAPVKKSKLVEKVIAGYTTGKHEISYYLEDKSLAGILRDKCIPDDAGNFNPLIEEFDVSAMDESKVAELVIKKNIWMMVKGIPAAVSLSTQKTGLNAHSILNKVLCPLLLIPSDWQLKDIERLVYIADLRYCRIEIVKYLAQLAKPWNAGVSIAHLSAKGLPDMAEKYALTVFSEEVSRNVNYDQLVFNNIREKDLSKAVDVMINGMHNDILVMVNHRFHFEEIVGRYITDTLPVNITVPVLIFPY